MSFDFSKNIEEAVEAKQKEIRIEAAREVLAGLFAKPALALTELKNVLVEADRQELLKGLKLGDFIFRSSAQAGSGRTGKIRLTPKAKAAAMEAVLAVLKTAKKPMSRTAIIASADDEILKTKWQSVIRALDKQGLIKDNGESRSKKAYLITEKGKGM